MLNARRPHFLQVFHPNVCSDRLKVPEKFIRHLEGRTRGSVLLIGPSGNSWNINLSMHDEELFLDDGWATFLKDHSIECGDSLVFRYDGDLQFSVQIFDETSCEKEVAFCAKHSEDRLIGRKRERGRKHVLSNPAYTGSQRKTRSINSPTYLECETASKELVMDKHDHKLSCSGLKEKVSLASRKAVVMAMSSHGNVQTGTRASQRKPKAAMEKKSNISTFIEQKVTEYFVSQFPYFVRVMKASNVSSSGTLKLPVQFSTKHLPSCRTNVVLKNMEGGSWTLSSVPTERAQTMHTLCGGWTSFVRDNDLKMEDICIFELLGECEMRVRIMKLGIEGLDCEGLKGGISGCAVSSALFASKKDEPVPTSPKGKNPEKRSLLNSYDKGVTATKSADGASAAESFTSRFPNFIKVMKISNISGPYTMNIPSTFATAHFPSCRTEIILRNLKGESWSVKSYPSSIRCTAHTLCGGWMAFVRENDINLGDTCVFELVGKEELQVHIFKNGQRALESRNSDAHAESIVDMNSTGCTDLFDS